MLTSGQLRDISNELTPATVPQCDVTLNQTSSRYNLRPRTAKKGGEGAKTATGNKKKLLPDNNDDASSKSIVPYQYSAPAKDIDEADKDDPQFCTTYVEDIQAYLRSKESSVPPDYMGSAAEINEHMRMILVNWLVEVHLKFDLVAETLYLAVSIVDRYLASSLAKKDQVTRSNLQLVGITALLIASKYEEIYEIALEDCVYICDRAFPRVEIIDMEANILQALEFRISFPTAHTFLVRYLKAANASTKIVHLSYFILDGTLQSYYLLHFLPSQLAAAAVFVARKAVGRNAWSPTLLKHASYREEDILPVARAVVFSKTYCSVGLYAVDTKYAHAKYGEVSNIELPSDL